AGGARSACWEPGARGRAGGRISRPNASAPSPPMPKLSSEARPRRSTFLSFQPPAVGEEEVEAAAEAIRSGWLTSGPRVAELERRAAELLDARHVLALSSRTPALHLRLLAAGHPPAGRVTTTAHT